jgi:hypothetical protein
MADSYPDFIDCSPSGFVDALCKRLDGVLKSFWQEGELPDSKGIPHVHAQYLPVSKTESEERDKTKDYPIVQVVCITGTVSDFHPAANGSEITIHIYFGGYQNSTDNQGWRIPANMLWKVMQDFLDNKIVDGYILEAPIKWTLLNSRELPYYTAMMETKWKGAPPAIETPFEGLRLFMRGAKENFKPFRRKLWHTCTGCISLRVLPRSKYRFLSIRRCRLR